MSQLITDRRDSTAVSSAVQVAGNQTTGGRNAGFDRALGNFVPAQPATGDTAPLQSRFEPLGRSRTPSAPLDRHLLEKSEELLDGIENATPDEAILSLESLRCTIGDLWKSAALSDLQHQSLLALIEGFLKGRDSLDFRQAAAIRGAVKDLAAPRLSEQHLEIIRSGLVDEGHNPFVAFSGIAQ